MNKRPRYRDVGLVHASCDVFKGEDALALCCERLQTVKYKNPGDVVGRTEK